MAQASGVASEKIFSAEFPSWLDFKYPVSLDPWLGMKASQTRAIVHIEVPPER